MNSKLVEFYLHKRAPLKQGGYFSYSAAVLSSVPVAIGPQGPRIEYLVNQIVAAKRDGDVESVAFEAEIDKHVYALYGLTKEEIAVVEAAAT